MKAALPLRRSTILLGVILVLVPLLVACIPRGRAPGGDPGSRCSSNTQCTMGLVCLTAADGFPGGYCTAMNCEQSGCASSTFGAAACAHLDEARTTTACVQSCSNDADCRRSEGYVCSDLDGISGCMPTDIAAAGAGAIGSSCVVASDCNGGLICLNSFLSGYCSQQCTSDVDCGEEASCADVGGGELRCLDNCADDAQCRFGYECQDQGATSTVCFPGAQSGAVRNPGGAPDGEPCTMDVECMGGACITGSDFPGGYCSTSGCDVVGCSSADATCVNLQSEALCFSNCSSTTECREGYRCAPLQGGNGVCYAKSSGVTPMINTGGPITISCDPQTVSGNLRRFSFDIEAGTDAFVVVPFSQNNGEIVPIQMTMPDGSTLDFERDYAFQTINALLLATIVPMMFPGAPQFANLVQPGTYTFDYETTDPESCYFVVEQSGPGTTLDINFYLVGVDGITPANAATNPSMTALVNEFESIYQAAGISLGQVRYFSLTASEEEEYRIIRDLEDTFDLLALSQSPGDTRDEALSVNVFFIEDFNVDGLPGIRGLSAGIPGVPGVHGNSGAGLVFTSADLTAEPLSLAQTMAHEMGHFLGLRHTTERGGEEIDPLSDTPSCANPNDQYNCPDVDNLMFPFSLDIDQKIITNDQRFVMQLNPLVK